MVKFITEALELKINFRYKTLHCRVLNLSNVKYDKTNFLHIALLTKFYENMRIYLMTVHFFGF